MVLESIQLIFAKHDYGNLSYETEIQHQPPLGILTLATYLKSRIPKLNVEVIDGKVLPPAKIIDRIKSKYIGFSIWFSNYRSTITLIKETKEKLPNSKIIVGGPHSSYLAEKIIRNNEYIDFLISGEGEIPIYKLLSGTSLSEIPNLWYRENGEVFHSGNNNIVQVNMNDLPVPDLDLVYPKYKWLSNKESYAMSAFPIAGIRGCARKDRCEYCSIHFNGYRMLNPEVYWEHIIELNKKFGINFFFETGDIFSTKLLSKLAQIRNHPNILMRIYSYPGIIKSKHMPMLNDVGVNTIFMGIESSLIWRGNFKRKYKNDYNYLSIIDEVKRFNDYEIKVIPSFVFGLPGEDVDSLKETIDLITELKDNKNVNEVTVSALLPLPGSEYFNWCINDSSIITKYKEITANNLTLIDDIDIYLLSQIFINEYTRIRYYNIYITIQKISKFLKPGLANWGMTNPILY